MHALSVAAELSLRIPGGVDAPAEARRVLRRAHPELPRDLMQVLTLLASELVSNAVRHAGAGSVALRVDVEPACVHVEVADDGPGFDVAAARPAGSRAGGWGLRVVDELATRWGVIDGPPTRVWFELEPGHD